LRRIKQPNGLAINNTHSNRGIKRYSEPKAFSVDEQTTINQLEELAERFGVRIRYEPIKEDEDSIHLVGGLCLLRGELGRL